VVLKKKVSKGKTASVADASRRSEPAAAAAVPSATKKAAPRRATAAKQGATARARKAPPADADVLHAAVESTIAPLRDAVRAVTALVERLTAPARADTAVDAAVDALRRVLSDLIEQRTESVVRTLVDIRRDAAGLVGGGGAGIVERLDQVLDGLGAVRFEAEAMDVVDPLIHVVVEERQRADAPDGVILETARPGYRTARGVVVCKAAVVVNQRS
jgi:molecular chaperone GrpE (heat shock protein)